MAETVVTTIVLKGARRLVAVQLGAPMEWPRSPCIQLSGTGFVFVPILSVVDMVDDEQLRDELTADAIHAISRSLGR